MKHVAKPAFLDRDITPYIVAVTLMWFLLSPLETETVAVVMLGIFIAVGAAMLAESRSGKQLGPVLTVAICVVTAGLLLFVTYSEAHWMLNHSFEGVDPFFIAVTAPLTTLLVIFGRRFLAYWRAAPW